MNIRRMCGIVVAIALVASAPDALAKLDQTIVFTSIPPSTYYIGITTYRVTAVASSGLPVTFSVPNNMNYPGMLFCSVNVNGYVSVGHVGTCIIQANQAGDALYNPAPMVSQSFGIAPALPDIAVSPSSIDFGSESVTTTSGPQVVTITNTGNILLDLSSVVAPLPFLITHDCGPMHQNFTCHASISFAPTSIGSFSGRVRIGSFTDRLTLSGVGEASLVPLFYRQILGRVPDASGKSFWDTFVDGVLSVAGNAEEASQFIAIAFFSGQEYAERHRDDAEFVTDLYHALLNRDPDESGLRFWTQQLSGLPRDAVLDAVLLSEESGAFTRRVVGTAPVGEDVRMVMDLYRGLLRRPPDVGGFSHWLARLRIARCTGPAEARQELISIASQFISSPEYVARNRSESGYVADLYDALFERGADPEGMQFWSTASPSGVASHDDMLWYFISGPEFGGRISALTAQSCFG